MKRIMVYSGFLVLLGVLMLSSLGCSASLEAQSGPSQSTEVTSESTGLILQENEGERFVRRWGLPAVLKVDQINGRSKHLVMITEDLPPGTAIPVHRHDHADEILLVQKGTGIATLGEKRAKVTAGATIFIPRGTWVGLENTGQETISIVAIFSAPGYDEYFRATSVPEGQEVTPLSPDEVLKIRQKYRDYIIFKEP